MTELRERNQVDYEILICEENIIFNYYLQERSEKLKAYKTKSEALEDCVSRKCEDVSLAQENLQGKCEDVKKLARLRVQQLFKYIFPISVVKPIM